MKYILIDTNRNSNIIDSEEKNNDFEKILISLKNDKDKIIKENQEKDKEIKKLKEFLTKKEKDTQKNLTTAPTVFKMKKMSPPSGP